jgi:hypothetical protein
MTISLTDQLITAIFKVYEESGILKPQLSKLMQKYITPIVCDIRKSQKSNLTIDDFIFIKNLLEMQIKGNDALIVFLSQNFINGADDIDILNEVRKRGKDIERVVEKINSVIVNKEIVELTGI